jgi:adenylate cyclase class 2
MSIEIEKKYRMTEEQRNVVIASLAEFSAEYIGEDVEENIIYSGSILSEKNAVLRVRIIGDRAILTYKLRLAGTGEIKRQIEEETEVSDPKAIQKIVKELGFKPVLIYEKRRRTWRFRSVEVVLDELPFGLFMEIEGSITGIKEAELLLDLDDLATEHKTYPQLTGELGVKNGEVIEARFGNAAR